MLFTPPVEKYVKNSTTKDYTLNSENRYSYF